MTKFLINNRTDAWKTDVNLLNSNDCFQFAPILRTYAPLSIIPLTLPSPPLPSPPLLSPSRPSTPFQQRNSNSADKMIKISSSGVIQRRSVEKRKESCQVYWKKKKIWLAQLMTIETLFFSQQWNRYLPTRPQCWLSDVCFGIHRGTYVNWYSSIWYSGVWLTLKPLWGTMWPSLTYGGFSQSVSILLFL